MYLDEQLLAARTVSFQGNAGDVHSITITDLLVPNVRLWEPANPNLYQIRLELENDDLTERIGFRTITVQDGKLLLNNREIKLKGINRHEDHPDWGFAVPLKLMKKDLDIIKNLGCNAIRGSHYPNAPIFLDLLDQEGSCSGRKSPCGVSLNTPLKIP